MTKLVSPEPDAVSEVLRSLAVRSTIFCLSELRAPWAFRVDGEKVPKCTRHTLADDQATPTMTLERLVAEAQFDDGSPLRYGGTGAVTRLLCGGFSLAEGVPQSALAGFPEVLRVEHHNAAATTWLEHVLATLISEADNGSTDSPSTSGCLARPWQLGFATASGCHRCDISRSCA